MTPLVAYLLLFVAVGAGFIFVHLVAGKMLRPNKPGAEKQTIYECGEPTIGSAWIQFDLRFYVVALLFVIFDVEVAFFFPWAEVFGKANNIVANASASDFAAVQAVSREILDLTPDYPENAHKRQLSKLVTGLTEAEFMQLRELARDESKYTQEIGPKKAPADKLTAEATALEKEAADLDKQGKKPAADAKRRAAKAARDNAEKIVKALPTPYQFAVAQSTSVLTTLEDTKENASTRRVNAALRAMDNIEFDSLTKAGTPFPARELEGASSLSMTALGEIVVFFGVLLVGFAYLWKRGDLAWVRSLQAERQAATQRSVVVPVPEPVPDTVLVGAGAAKSHH